MLVIFVQPEAEAELKILALVEHIRILEDSLLVNHVL
jgi:hypothetical protein